VKETRIRRREASGERRGVKAHAAQGRGRGVVLDAVVFKETEEQRRTCCVYSGARLATH
jgi:hypothetical protein